MQNWFNSLLSESHIIYDEYPLHFTVVPLYKNINRKSHKYSLNIFSVLGATRRAYDKIIELVSKIKDNLKSMEVMQKDSCCLFVFFKVWNQESGRNSSRTPQWAAVSLTSMKRLFNLGCTTEACRVMLCFNGTVHSHLRTNKNVAQMYVCYIVSTT